MWPSRSLDFDLSFLGNGNHEAVIFQDGVNAAKNAKDYKKDSININGNSRMSVNLAPGGGFAMIIK